jgi:2-(3-amino-3-carboxypropyl)histidine synthase
VFIGDGVFHPLNIKKSYSSKKVFTINPFTLTVAEITDDDVKRYAFREAVGNDKLKHADNVGIILTSKLGQNKTRKALELKTKLERKGKNVYLFLSDNINPDEFLNFLGLDVLVNTACPRIAMDDYSKFPVTVLDIHSIKES